MTLLALALALFLALGAGCGQEKADQGAPPSAPAKEAQATAPAEEEQEPSYGEKVNEVVATIGDAEITRQMLQWYAKTAQEAGFSEKEIMTKPTAELKPLVENLAVSEQTMRRAQEPDSGVDEKELANMKNLANGQLLRRLSAKEVWPGIPEPTEAEIEAFYTSNTAFFTTPFTFSMRQIFVSTYEPVETKEGDTLDDLARKISGGIEQIENILIDNTEKTPRAPGWLSGGRMTVKPLEPGEHLLVPMSAEGKKVSYAKIEEAKKRIEGGEDFMEVVKEVSPEHGQRIDGLPHTGRSLLPQYIEAAKKTNVGELTDIFETKHGYNLMRIEAKTEEQLMPLEEVRQTVVNRVIAMKRRKAYQEYVDKLFTTPELKIDYDAYRNPETPDDAIVARLGDGRTFTFGSLKVKNMGEPMADMSDAEVLDLLRTNTPLRYELELFHARQLDLDDTPEYRMTVAGIYSRVGKSYQDARLKQAAAAEISEAEAKEYFEKHQDEFSTHLRFTFHLFSMEVADPKSQEVQTAALTELAGWLENVQTLDDFKKMIAEHATNKQLKAVEGLLSDIPAGRVAPQMLAELSAMSPGSKTKPLYIEPNVQAAWILSREEPRTPTYEEIKPNLQNMVRQLKVRRLPDAIRTEMLEAARVVMR